MVHENEDDEIEQYLVEKISHAIDRLDDQQNLVTKLYSFKDEFKSLLNELKIKTKPNVMDDWSIVRRNNLYSLNNLVTDWQLTKNQSSLSAKEVYESCENINKSLKKMKKEIDGEESSSRGDRDGSTTHQEPYRPIFKRNKDDVHRWSSRHPPTKVRGSDHRVLALERDLVMRNVDAPFKAFGVVGAAGIGKTTLCQTIFGRDLVKQRFCPRIWVCLSKQRRDISDYRKEIVIRILQNLGIEDEVIENAGNDREHGLRRLILLLRLQLTGKRYLIVLDDAWNEDNNVVQFFSNLNKKEQLDENWGEELAYGLPKGCGGTLISSSTSKALLKQMLGEDVGLQYMTRRTDETIYEIFKDTVIGYDHEDQREFPLYLEELKDELLKKCDGNPLAAKLLAKIAREHLKIKPKLQPPPVTGAGGNLDQIKQVQAVGVDNDIGGGRKNSLPPVGSDQME